MFKQDCLVLENKEVASKHFVIKLRSKNISKTAKPGQFVQILCADDSYDPLLPRPFSFLKTEGDTFSILYQAAGRGTGLLSKKVKGESVSVLGPLGNGYTFGEQRTENREQKKKITFSIVLVGGGVGIPPLHHLAKTWLDSKIISKENIHVILGARNKSLLLCEKEFKKLGVNLSIATDDGSKGKKGFVTDILTSFLSSLISHPSSHIYTCGPTPMLKAVSAIAVKQNLPCEVSVEVPMACGFGACLGCAIKVREQKTENREQEKSSGFRYAVACKEGPVFQASEIIWE